MSTKNLSLREWMRGGVAAVAATAIPGARARAGADETRRGAQRLAGTPRSLGVARLRHVHPLRHEHVRRPGTALRPGALDALRARPARRGPVDSGGARRGHEVRGAHHQARLRPLPVAQQAHRLHVGTSGNTTDVVEAFVKACEQARRHARLLLLHLGQPPPLRLGTRSEATWRIRRLRRRRAACTYTTRLPDFQTAQIKELLTQYGRSLRSGSTSPARWARRPATPVRPDRRAAAGDSDHDEQRHRHPAIVATSTPGPQTSWPSSAPCPPWPLPPWFIPANQGQDYYLPARSATRSATSGSTSRTTTLRSDVELLGMRHETLPRARDKSAARRAAGQPRADPPRDGARSCGCGATPACEDRGAGARG